MAVGFSRLTLLGSMREMGYKMDILCIDLWIWVPCVSSDFFEELQKRSNGRKVLTDR